MGWISFQESVITLNGQFGPKMSKGILNHKFIRTTSRQFFILYQLWFPGPIPWLLGLKMEQIQRVNFTEGLQYFTHIQSFRPVESAKPFPSLPWHRNGKICLYPHGWRYSKSPSLNTRVKWHMRPSDFHSYQHSSLGFRPITVSADQLCVSVSC